MAPVTAVSNATISADATSSSEGPSLRWVVLAIIVAGLALSGPYSFSIRAQPDGGILVTPTPARAVVYWIAWTAAVPMLVAASRYPLTLRPTGQRVAAHIALALCGSAAHALTFGFFERFGWDVSAVRVAATPPSFLLETLRGLWEYALFLASIHAVLFARSFRAQQREAMQQQTVRAQLETELARAEVAALQAQLHPHFLFNALNSIAVLTMQNPTSARDTTIQLGALLRTVMQRSREQVLSLGKELDVVDRYIAIQRMRFGDRLVVEMRVDDDSIDALVPTMLVQPLVENAIRHAVEVAGRGKIVLVARRVRDQLELSVEDDGALGAGQSSPGSGVGLENLRRRLDLLFPGTSRIELTPRRDGGTVVSVALPYRTDASDITR
jgi:hypothetical protein